MKEKLVITKLRKSMIHVRGGFSETHNMGSCNTEIQMNDLDDRTRTLLYNVISSSLRDQFGDAPYNRDIYLKEDFFCRYIIGYALAIKIDPEKHYAIDGFNILVEKVFLEAPYNEVLDLIELITRHRYSDNETNKQKQFYDFINMVFEREYVGYRMIDGKITPIADENEKESIEEACENKFEGTRAHISKALGFISDREHPDYKNSVKESISAVESVCSIIVGDECASLGKALKRLKDNGVNIHPTLEVAFSKLYGYTSDEGGIRHAEGMTESEVTFEDAKFMLVSCSAFVNYLTANYGKIGGGK